MSAWVELEPDFGPTPLELTDPALPFSVMCAAGMLPPETTAVIVLRSARKCFETHLLEHSVETGGLLVGRILDGAPLSGATCVVEEAVPSRHFDGTSVSLSMTTEVWNDAKALSGNGRGVIGWYHSHPNLGAFFSGTDRRTQKGFFRLSHSLGLVRDPIQREEKWFVGPDCHELPVSKLFVA
jgi:proteasome lid subunit RPN8/RPN11